MNKHFRRTVYFVWVMGLFAMGQPFYILFAQKQYGLAPSIAGRYLAWQFAGFVCCNFLWSYFSDRQGNRKVLKGVSFLALILPAFTLFHSQTDLPVVWFSLVFFMIGGVRSGLIIGAVNYVVEISPGEQRPTYLGTIHTLMAIPAFSPVLGGWIIERFSFETLFIILTFSASIAIFLAYRLIEPRKNISKDAVTNM
jgi:MFS family permease